MAASFPVLLGTTRQGNATEPVARFARDRIDHRPDASAQLYRAEDLPFGNLKQRVSGMDPVPEGAERFVEAMDAADGFVLVTPEYNHGYPGALKNLIDHTYDPWYRKAFGLVTTGGSSGGLRAEEQLRLVITGGLGGTVVPRAVNVPRVRDAFNEEGPVDEETWTKRFDRLAEELVVYAEAMAEVRDRLDS